MHKRAALRWCVAMAVLAGCGFNPVDDRDGGSSVPQCVPGKVESCPCLGGQSGIQTCLSSGTFGSCQCAPSNCLPSDTFTCSCAGGGFGTRACGSTACSGCPGRPDAGALPDGGLVDQSVVLYAGTDTLVDLFPVQGGLIVVRSTVVQLLDLVGNELAHVDSPREITAAAFDGTLLGVADRALLTVYDTALTPLRTTTLIESCASAVTISAQRFVCGPANDWDRIYSVFDMNTGQLLRHGPEMYTYDGIPMRRVPGTDDFVTVTIDSSPSDFSLFRVASGVDAGVLGFGDSPYHGAFAATTVFAFDRTPAQHLINQEGIMLKIYAPTCGSAFTGCFVRDGELGTLPNGSMFLAMTEVGNGTIYGVAQHTPSSFYDPDCVTGCDVQRIDVDARVIRGSVSWVAPVARIVATRFDSYQQQLVIGYLLPAPSGSQSYGGFRIVSFTP